MKNTPTERNATFSKVGYGISLLIALLLPFLPFVELIDLKLLDLQFNVQRSIKPKPVENDVVVIGINENTYAGYPEPFALWHSHLGDLMKALAVAKPSVVGLDITLPDRSYNSVVPGIDQKLLHGMVILKKVAPLVLGSTIEQVTGDSRKIYPPFVSVAGGSKHKAYVIWQQDQDRVVRRFDPTFEAQTDGIPMLASTMADFMRLKAEAGLIDYGLGQPIDYVPLQQVVTWFNENKQGKLTSTFADKPVLVGTVLPFEDRHYQPVNLAAWEEKNNNFVPGVLLHAQALRTIMAGGFIQPAKTWIILFTSLLVAGFWWLSRKPLILLLVYLITATIILIAQGLALHNSLFLPVAAPLLSLFVAMAGRLGFDNALQLMEKKRLRQSFGGYVSPQVLDEILNGNLLPGVHGERRHICVLFSDIRGFTSISEHMQPEEIIKFLNRYLAAMTEAIQSNGGTLDKFIGDGIMAFFGAPKATDKPVHQAFAAAKAKLDKLSELNKTLSKETNMPTLEIGIGLHVGDAVVGNIGSEQRNDYTAIGDVVNTASRLEGLTKQTGYPLVVSASVADLLRSEVEFDDLGELAVKGRAPVSVYGWPPKA